ncbi:MAG: SPFH domain-containing protein [Candidatus Sumerlaeaceae bacterium]|jgi:regulator of protease activity HflC (stomatin/prohibitin superfamily)
MDAFVIFLIVLAIFVIVIFAKTVRVVPQGEEWLVERLGKFRAKLDPGLNFVVPFLDRIAYQLVTKDLILDIEEQEVITRDNAVILTNAVAFVRVTDPVKAAYGVTNFAQAIRNLIMTTLRSIIGEMELDEALSSRDRIKARLREAIVDEAADWGITVKSVEIQDIRPSPSMQKAMEQQAAAERERKAMVTRAEGEKQSAILQAEARLEAARRDAEARVTLAKASAESIRQVAQSIGENPSAMWYLLGERYVTALDRLAHSPNGKVFVLPADLQAAVKGLFDKKN